MGLDMFLYAGKIIKKEKEIGYWRKHPDLHDHIAELYYSNGGEAEEFNCVPYELSENEIEKIIELCENNKLKKSKGGFFFGETKEYHNKETIEIMKKALFFMKQGYTITYDSWW